MRQFKLGQRVFVRNCEGVPICELGTVERLRRNDDGAWVRLDERSTWEGVHHFSIEDSRANNVLAFPGDCDPAKETP